MYEIERLKAVVDQDEIHRMARSGKVKELKYSFAILEDKKQAWDDLIRLPSDMDIQVRIAANHSSGKVSIFRASKAENEEGFRKEMYTALDFFEKSSYSDSFSFCLFANNY